MIHVRHAGALDAAAMARLLNEIIRAGGTTAMTDEVAADDILRWMRQGTRAAWQIAEDDAGALCGFQWIEQVPDLPPEAAEIATFVQRGQTGLGIGSALFRATEAAARALGYAWIRANIRADNRSGLTYYQSRGFEDYGAIRGYRLRNGQVVDKVLKRFDLQPATGRDRG